MIYFLYVVDHYGYYVMFNSVFKIEYLLYMVTRLRIIHPGLSLWSYGQLIPVSSGSKSF